MALTGTCNCNSVSITLEHGLADLNEPFLCHCSSCKKSGGGDGLYGCFVPKEKVNVEGATKVWVDTQTRSGVPMERHFCAGCGTPLLGQSSIHPGEIVVVLGIFPEIPEIQKEYFGTSKK